MNCNKVKYPSAEHANKAISKAWSGARGWRGKQLPVRCYKCQCKSWHLTSKPFMTHEELQRKVKSNA